MPEVFEPINYKFDEIPNCCCWWCPTLRPHGLQHARPQDSKLPALNFFPLLPQNQPQKGYILIVLFIPILFSNHHMSLKFRTLLREGDYSSPNLFLPVHLLFTTLIIILNLDPLSNIKED